MGPLLGDSQLGSPGDVSSELRPMLDRNRTLWRGQAALAKEGFHYTVSYNQWAGPLERLAEGLPAGAWTKGEGEEYALGSHTSSGLEAAHRFALVRRRDGLLVRDGFVACNAGQRDAAQVFTWHRLNPNAEMERGAHAARVLVWAARPNPRHSISRLADGRKV